jgi:hypothetical protein
MRKSKPVAPEGKKWVSLTGNNRTRRTQFKELCKTHGVDKVKRIDNSRATCKKTIAEVTL